MKGLNVLCAACFVAIFALISGCGSTLAVRSEEAPSLNERADSTYHLMIHQVGRYEAIDGLIEQTITERMGTRGYVASSSAEAADLLVTYKILIDDEETRAVGATDEDIFDANFNAGVPAMSAGAPAMFAAPAQDPSMQKVMVVMFQDARDGQIVWLGWSVVETSRASIRDSASEAIREIMARAPQRRQ